MALDFPNTPTVGEMFPPTPIVGMPQYIWDGEKWSIDSIIIPPSSSPTLTLITPRGDYTPDFNMTTNFAVGDVVRFQWDNVHTFDSGALAQLTNTIDVTEDGAMILDFTTGTLTTNTWYFRSRVERGATIGSWTNIVTWPPFLALLTPASDRSPEFNLTSHFVVGDVVRFQYDNVSAFNSGALVQRTNTIDAGEDLAMTLDFSTGDLAAGTWYFRARVERGTNIFSWSNTLSQILV